ncbi:MAG: hypothetical protein CVU48_11160 [Candidatus Cloacimonetes bacterium HGW-Cloacimonetes-1]|jgi:hypothetical protein|nr:MAG: hypothetical protein CVU48_11160 [Candidatus Cloacimonetes bacterium HGW-Cloacimonetes-1]
MKNRQLFVILILLLVLISGCDRKTGDVLTDVTLPTDYILNLYSASEGIYPDTSIMDNPLNPFAHANVNMQNIWDLTDECPSPKSRFYLWGTLLANSPTGEHQYFTARSLHELYTMGGSENAKEQAKKAYRATLDHFFDSVTWWQAEWIVDETHYAVLLRNLVAQNLYDPTGMNLLPLYSDPVLALADLSEWGYVYDTQTKTLARRN